MANHFLEDLIGTSGGIRAVQQGDLDNVTSTAGTSPQDRYYDVTVATVQDTLKCFVLVTASGSQITGASGRYADGSNIQYMCRGKLTSTTNLRIYAAGGTYFEGSWQIVEFN